MIIGEKNLGKNVRRSCAECFNTPVIYHWVDQTVEKHKKSICFMGDKAFDALVRISKDKDNDIQWKVANDKSNKHAIHRINRFLHHRYVD